MSSPLARALADKRLVVFVGEGGVGKTSTAAAIALARAQAGKRSAVLTIDPAPRLGDALGLDAIDESPRVVDLGEDCPGRLTAMRLDAERTFDRLVERLAPSPESAATILENPIYRALSGSLGGAEAYMAFQRLYELDADGDYDTLFLDTPPAAHAAELLSAPLRLTALLDSGAAAVLANPAILVARAGTSVARAGLGVILAMLERITGGTLRRQVTEFITHFEDVLEGLSRRAGAVDDMLRAPETLFVQVVRPRMPDVAAAAALRASLAERGLLVGAIVVNRLTPGPAEDRTVARKVRLAGAPPGTLEAVGIIEADLDSLRTAEATAVRELRRGIECVGSGRPPIIAEVASLEHDVNSTDDLAELGRALLGRHAGAPAARTAAAS